MNWLPYMNRVETCPCQGCRHLRMMEEQQRMIRVLNLWRREQ